MDGHLPVRIRDTNDTLPRQPWDDNSRRRGIEESKENKRQMNALKICKEHWMLIGITVAITSTILIAAGMLFHDPSKAQRNNEPTEEKLIDKEMRELDQLLAIINKI